MSTPRRRKSQGGTGRPGPERPGRNAAAAVDPPLFNERIRKSGKWVFLGLVLVFALSTVLSGVGATNSAPNLLDYLQNRGADDGVTTPESATPDRIREAQAATKAKPKDAAAWLALGEAYAGLPAEDAVAATRNHEEATKAIAQAAKLKPDDIAIQERLGEAYAVQAADAQSQIQRLYGEAQQLSSAGTSDALVIPGGGANADPFTKARQEIVSEQANAIYQKAAPYQEALGEATKGAVAAYKKVAAARPEDGNALFTLGSVAASGGDTQTAITAFEKFLKLFPGDPVSDQVKESVKQLKAQAAPPTATPAGGGASGTSTTAE
jgi:cytochrome c-type biogenesis protein CcmH/NrfG